MIIAKLCRCQFILETRSKILTLNTYISARSNQNGRVIELNNGLMSLVRMICYYLEEGFHCSKKTSRLCSSLDFNCIVLLSDNCPRLLCSLVFLMSFVSLHSHVSAMCPDIFLQLVFFRICIYICILYSLFKITFLLCLPYLPHRGAPIFCISHFFCIFFCFYFHFIPFPLWLPLAPASPPRCPG